MNDPKLLTSAEAARRLRVSVRTVERWTERGILAAQVLPNGHRRYRVDDVEAALTRYKPGDDDAAQDDTEADSAATGSRRSRGAA